MHRRHVRRSNCSRTPIGSTSSCSMSCCPIGAASRCWRKCAGAGWKRLCWSLPAAANASRSCRASGWAPTTTSSSLRPGRSGRPRTGHPATNATARPGTHADLPYRRRGDQLQHARSLPRLRAHQLHGHGAERPSLSDPPSGRSSHTRTAPARRVAHCRRRRDADDRPAHCFDSQKKSSPTCVSLATSKPSTAKAIAFGPRINRRTPHPPAGNRSRRRSGSASLLRPRRP